MTAGLRRGAKTALAYALYYSGILHLWQRVALRNRAVVLMYHRVLSEDERRRTGSHPGIVVGRDTFAWQMALLKRRFSILTVEDLARHLAEGAPFPHSSCVITFDDGWRDSLTGALPVLQRLSLPAIVFLPVNFIGRRRLFWREALTHLIVDVVRLARTDSSLRSRVAPVLAAAGLAGLLDADHADPRPAVIAAIAAQPELRVTAAAELRQALESIIGRSVDPSSTPDMFVSWDEVVEMARAGLTFGGHGAEHVLLAEVPREEAETEVREAYDCVTTRCSAPATVFSYPNGSFNADVVEIVKSAGFRMAFTTRPGRVRSSDNPLTLPRINIHEDATKSAPMFLARVLGVL